MSFYQSGHRCCQPDETYFVESHDDALFQPRETVKEKARRIAKQRQYAIADELSRLATEEYAEDILTHMEFMEGETLPDIASIDIQTEIKWFMRPYLLDFLIEGHAAYQLLPETLFLAVNILDRYCSKRVVYKRHYQLVGCCSLLIAAKYGDRKDRVPTIRELQGMCCSLYDEDMFIQMEWHILQTLNWVVGHPTVDTFLQMALSEAGFEDPEVEHMALCMCEMGMFHREFVSTRPSNMARSALFLARHVLNRPQPDPSEWSANYEAMTAVNLSHHLHSPSQVVAKKYASTAYSRVSVTLESFLIRQQSQRAYAHPPTPPCDGASDPKPVVVPGFGPQTPQKNQFSGNMHGYMTPPITPEGEYFGASSQVKGFGMVPPRCPATPTPSSGHAQQYDYNQYHTVTFVE